jgi:hypothetical protein
MYTNNPLGSMDGDNGVNGMPLLGDMTGKSIRLLSESSRMLFDPLNNKLKTKL